MFCPPRLNGNMPAVLELSRYIRGETILIPLVLTTTGMADRMIAMILRKPVMWGSMLPTHGVYLICMEIFGSGLLIGKRTILKVKCLIPKGGHRARSGSGGVVPGAATGRYCVLLSASTTPLATVATTSASVLLSKRASKKRAPYGATAWDWI